MMHCMMSDGTLGSVMMWGASLFGIGALATLGLSIAALGKYVFANA